MRWLTYVTYSSSIHGSWVPRRRHIFSVGLHFLLFVKEPSGPSWWKTRCSCWSWTNYSLVCAERKEKKISLTLLTIQHHVYVPRVTRQRESQKRCQDLLFLFVAGTGLLLSVVPSLLAVVGPVGGGEAARGRQGSFSPQDGQNRYVASSFSPHCEQKLMGILQENEGVRLM